ncbi:MAG: cysteine synthase A [Planctomycetota bacterium]
MKAAASILELIGKTPLCILSKLAENVSSDIIVKLENQNPGGSIKDRIGIAMLEAAEKSGDIKEGSVIIEPTSGNTGLGLAMACAAKNYQLILVMPESMSLERRQLLSAYGAEIILTPAAEGMTGAVKRARTAAMVNPDYFMPQQFENQANPEIHRQTTAVEIINDTEGDIDIFIAGVGTGGTITGAGEVLKDKIPNLKVYAVEPEQSAVLSGNNPGPHTIQGIGAGFIPNVLNKEVYDGVITVADKDAAETSKLLARKEGILGGISSGANIFAALQLAEKPENKGKKILTVICDTGERYLSTGLFE